jgi:hypothetical protein
MRRTVKLQEILKMGFAEAYGGWQGGRLTKTGAAQLLGVCEGTFRRDINQYKEDGLDGLILQLEILCRLHLPDYCLS